VAEIVKISSSEYAIDGDLSRLAWMPQDTFRKLAISYDRLPEIRKGGRLLAYSMINFRVFFNTC